MKKKIATLLMVLLMTLTVLTGCNLFSKDNSLALNSIVATNGNISVTREELINAYNNGGYYYTSYYGYTQEEALKKTIDEIIDQKYLVNYLDGLTNSKYALDSDDYCKVVSDTWAYIDKSLETFVKEVRKEFGLKNTELTTGENDKEPEFAPQKSYTSKFYLDNGKVVYNENGEEDDDVTVHESFASQEEAKQYALTKYDYTKRIKGDNLDLKKVAWTRYLTSLKSNQSIYKYSDMSDSAVFTRQMTKMFESNLDAQKIAKFQDVETVSNGLYFDDTLKSYVVSESTLKKIVDSYSDKFKANIASYDSISNKTSYYKNLVNTSNRDNYVYFGNSSEETLITCTHILIKLSEDQTKLMSSRKSDAQWQGSALEAELNRIRSQENTFAKERDLETGFEIEDAEPISVADLYSNVVASLRGLTDIEEITRIFNQYLYKYNVDTGIINAKYDYVVGTKNSVMVDSFTQLVRDLYDEGNGKVGSVGITYEENDNYSGYHIVMYTGTLNNLFDSKSQLEDLDTSNVYQYLSSQKTSVSYNQTLFEYFYDNVVKDIYSTIKKNTIDSYKNGTPTNYQYGNFSDMY